ncbi:MAG: apolipoprotein N-acyltransferase [Actinobacteria bacterium]|nr:apolipoprotein N-acyltransferase [Actinomycetota bacterium]
MIARIPRSLVAGLLVAAAMPPWGWWPLALAGVALYGTTVLSNESSPRKDFFSGWLFGVGWFLPAMAWMWFLTAPGYVIAVALFAAFHGCAALLAGTLSRRSNHQTPLLFAVTHTLAETLRMSFPFGGVPLATLGIANASSPLAALAPWGGVILLTVSTFWLMLGQHRLRRALVVVLVLVLASNVDLTSDSADEYTVALIQGGGEQGTHAVDTDPRVVFDRHMKLTRSLTNNQNIDAVIWPENVINVDDFESSPEFDELATEAKRLAVPLVVGVTEDIGENGSTNAQLVITADGAIEDRYDKVRRVPFGEYMPFRSVLSALSDSTNLVPRDAVAGRGPAVLSIGGVRASVAISWEVFFGGRVDEGVERGATFIINPTNGSSYTGTILQTQQVASSRLRAREQGRQLVQVSPTGFSAHITDRGDVLQRTGISEAKTVVATVQLREGRTVYSYTGNAPLICLLLLTLAAAMWTRRTISTAP